MKKFNRPDGISTSSDESDYDEEQDKFEELQEKKLLQVKKKKTQRISVSAEAYGEFNKKGQFKPPVHSKSNDCLKKIISLLDKSFLFKNLEMSEKTVIALAMEIKKYKKNDMVIKQNDDGNELFVVDSGKLSCTKVFSGQSKETFLLNYGPGDAFGELALLYNAPRAASIKADS